MNNNCPVCNSALGKDIIEFCPVCNWELFHVSAKASAPMLAYFQKRLDIHTEYYRNKKQYEADLKILMDELDTLRLQVQEQSKVIVELSKVKQENEAAKTVIKKLQEELEEINERHGDTWINNAAGINNTIVIKWEMVNHMRFRFYRENIEDYFPDQFVMQLKKSNRPIADADFNFALKINSVDKKMINPSCCEITVSNNELQSGKYYVRFTNLLETTYRIKFFHNEQGNDTSFDWNKTLVNL